MTTFDITAATPAEIDGRIARYNDEIARLESLLETTRKARTVLHNEYDRRGGWTRSFFVNNTDGHVHSSTHCSTLRYDTSITWLTDWSGKDEAEVIADAGWRACTVCFPDAPLGYVPSKLTSDEEKERDARRAEREAKAAEKAEKVVRDESGKVLFNTERAAEIEAVSEFAEAHHCSVMQAQDGAHRAQLDQMAREHAAAGRRIAGYLAAKRGLDAADSAALFQQLLAKAVAKVIREKKEWNKNSLSNSLGKAEIPAKDAVEKVIRKTL